MVNIILWFAIINISFVVGFILLLQGTIKKIRYFEGTLMLSCTQHTFGCAKRKKERKKESQLAIIINK
jgi:hypothetical protein